jgi:hypothetical protein
MHAKDKVHGMRPDSQNIRCVRGIVFGNAVDPCSPLISQEDVVNTKLPEECIMTIG